MGPLEQIEKWSHCAPHRYFIENLIAASPALSPTDQKCRDVSEDVFSNKIQKIYGTICNYLITNEKKLTLSCSSHLEILQKNINLYGSLLDESLQIHSIRLKTEGIIYTICQNLKYDHSMIKEKSKIQQFLSLLELEKNIFEPNNLEIYNEIKVLIRSYINSWNSKNLAFIFKQNANIPLIQTAFLAIKSIAMQINEASNADTKELYLKKIIYQLLNLEKVSSLIYKLAKKFRPISPTTLNEISLSMNKDINLKDFLNPYLLGENLLNKENIDKLESLLIDFIEEMEKSTTCLEKHRNKNEFLISSTSLGEQARLHQNTRHSKTLANKISALEPLIGNKNAVFEFKNRNNEKIAYFKVYKSQHINAEIMEQLIWDIAVIMGMESHFAATKCTSIKTYPDLMKDSVDEVELTWSDNSKELVKIKQKKSKGSIQAAENGIRLGDFLKVIKKSPPLTIPREDLIKGLLITAIMGFYDAHSTNIIVNPTGKIKFFDNSCSLPHSNGCILWGGNYLRPSFRSSLLCLEESHSRLTEEDRALISEEITKYKKGFKNLVEFLKRPYALSLIKKLPLKWFDINDSLSAMEERLDRLETALSNPKINHLSSLILESQPNLKLNIVLTYLHKGYPSKNYVYWMDLCADLEDCINACVSLNLNLELIKSMCDNPLFKIKEILNKLAIQPKYCKNREENKAYAAKLIKELKDSANIDFKDCSKIFKEEKKSD